MDSTVFTRLECEYLAEPCGIAVRPPVFSWQGMAGRLRIFDCGGTEVFDSGSAVEPPFRPAWTPQSRKRYCWQLENGSGKAVSAFETAYEDDFSWSPAHWIWDPYNPGGVNAPTSIFRTEFVVPELKPQAAVRLCIGAVGLCRAEINGQAVSDDVFMPGAVDFDRRTLYRIYPVEHLLLPDTNTTISVELAGGWHSGLIARTGINYDRPFYSTPDAFILRLELQMSPAEDWQLLAVSNSQWRAYNQGPRRSSDIYCGEYFDAARSAGDASPEISEIELPLKLEAANAPPVRRIMELEPVAVIRQKNCTIVDMGQNITGRERISFEAPAGTKIVIRHGEMLHHDGSLYTENLRMAAAVTTIIAPGGEFTFEPEFTFYGFRYLEVSGIAEFRIKGIVLHSDLVVTGTSQSSNSLLDKFMQNVLWSQRGNFLDIPTDCPQRDERRGWTGDAQIFAPVALFNMHGAAFFRKWLTDLRSGCDSAGRYPDFAPCWHYSNLRNFYGNSGWGDAGVIIPYTLYLYYGDKMLLRENAENIYRWIDWQAQDLLDKQCCSHARFGDWLNIDDPTGKEFISSAYFAYGAGLAARIGTVLGDMAEARRMAEHAELAKKYFRQHFLSADGVLLERSQCAAAMALKFGLLNAEEIAPAVRDLAENIRRKGHLTTGFLGTPLLLFALSENGESTLAYELLEATGCPSWLYPVTQGATTVWERWNSWNEKSGFADIGMNSFNHYAYGAAAAWVYQVAGGIQPDWEHPGFRQFKLAPQPGGSLSELTVCYDSPAGLIKSSWKRRGPAVEYEFEVPCGCVAELILPGREMQKLPAGQYKF